MRRAMVLTFFLLLVAGLVGACSADPVTNDAGDADASSLNERLTAIESRLDELSDRLDATPGDQPFATQLFGGVVETVDRGTAGTVSVTVHRLEDYPGGDLAGVLLRDSDGLVTGGFATRIDDIDFTTTVQLRKADLSDATMQWPPITDEILIAEPGRYVLFIWADTGLGGYSRWFPVNTDGRGLIGCVQTLDVVEGMSTAVAVDGDLAASGFGGVCIPPRDR